MRTAVDALWKLLNATNADLSEAMKLVIANQDKFGRFTESNKLIAGYYLKTGQFDELKKWASSADVSQAARALRGLRMAHLQGISAETFLKKTGLKDQLLARARELKVPSLDEPL